MGIKITTVKEAVQDVGLKILVHGIAGSGKTVMCATAGVPTLIISAESGLLSIKDAPDYVKTTPIKTMDDLIEVHEYLANEKHEFQWIALDSISEMGEVVLAEEKQVNKDARAAYGELITSMTDIIKKFRDLPLNVIMTAKQKRYTDQDTNRTHYGPDLPGQNLANSLPYLYDEVFALRVEKNDDGKIYRTIQTGPDIQYIAKDRSGKLDLFEKPNLKHISAKVFADRATKPKTPAATSAAQSEEK
jgi:hypothetical protein